MGQTTQDTWIQKKSSLIGICLLSPLTPLTPLTPQKYMAYTERFRQSDDFRREELIRVIEHSVENLTVQELEALYYDMSTKNYIND